MTSTSAQSAKERAALSRLRQILNEPGLLRASCVKMKHACGKSSCRCAKGQRRWHISWYVSQSNKGKPRMKSVPKEKLEQIRGGVARYQEARQLLAVVGDQYWDRVGKQTKK